MIRRFIHRLGITLIVSAALGFVFPAAGQSEPTHIAAFAWRPDGTSLAASTELGLCMLDATGSLIDQLADEALGATADIAWNADGSRLAASSWIGSTGALRIWDTARYELLLTIAVERSEAMPLAWSADSTRIAGADWADVKVWDTTSGAALAVLAGHAQGVIAVAWLDGEQLVTVDGAGTVRLWDIETATVFASIQQDRGILSAVVSPDKTLIAVTNGTLVTVWNLEPLYPVATLHGHANVVERLAWSSAGVLASAGHDDTIRIWDVQQQHLLRTIHTPGTAFYLSWTSDGEQLTYTVPYNASAESTRAMFNVNPLRDLCPYPHCH